MTRRIPVFLLATAVVLLLGAVAAGPSGAATPAVAGASTPSGAGYWLVGADGGVFAYGDAVFAGSTAGTRLAAPVVGMEAVPGTPGYWLAGSDGGVYALGAPFGGSLGGSALNARIVALSTAPR